MAFTQVNKTFGATRTMNSVTIACPKGQVVISMTDDLFAAIGRPRWAEVFVGEGEDEGSVLIAAAAEGSANAYSVWSNDKSPNLHKVGVSASRLSVKHSFKTRETTFEVVPEGLVVMIPAAEVAPRFVLNRRRAA